MPNLLTRPILTPTDSDYLYFVQGGLDGRATLANLFLNRDVVSTTTLRVTNIRALDNTASATIANGTGIMTIGSSVLTTTDINGGTIDGTTQSTGTISGPIAAGGTWTAAATWTLPAFTLGGTVTSNGQSFSGTIANLGTVTTVIINGGTLNNVTIGGVTPGAGSFTTLSASGVATFALGSVSAPSITFTGRTSTGLWSSAADTLDFSAGGARALQLNTAATGVNYFAVYPNSTGNPNILYATGADTNVTAQYSTRGSGGHRFTTGGLGSPTLQFLVADTASAVNNVQTSGGTTGNAPYLAVVGSNTNIEFRHISKGTGSHIFQTGGGSYEQFRVTNTTNSVNYVAATGGTAGGAPAVFVGGSDTNISMNQSTKGTGNFKFYTDFFTAEQFRIERTASAVNYGQITGGATGTGPTLSAQGSDTNINLRLAGKGTGSVLIVGPAGGASVQDDIIMIDDAGYASGETRSFMWRGGGAAVVGRVGFNYETVAGGTAAAFVVRDPYFDGGRTGVSFAVYQASAANPANYLAVVSGATGVAPSLTVKGETNVDLALNPAGTGNVRFGTHSALAGETVTGYITIKDSAGNARKLAVVS